MVWGLQKTPYLFLLVFEMCACPTPLGNAVSRFIMWLWSLAGSVSLTAVMQRKTTNTTSHIFTHSKKKKEVSLTSCLFTQEMDAFDCSVNFPYHSIARSVRLNRATPQASMVSSRVEHFRVTLGIVWPRHFFSLDQFAATVPEEGTTCVDSGASHFSIPTNLAFSRPVGLASQQRDGGKKKRKKENGLKWGTVCMRIVGKTTMASC